MTKPGAFHERLMICMSSCQKLGLYSREGFAMCTEFGHHEAGAGKAEAYRHRKHLSGCGKSLRSHAMQSHEGDGVQAPSHTIATPCCRAGRGSQSWPTSKT